tara:strand:- start:490 stop:948 length:459 start_codon:yes stop_codon:yes gene_type:complete
MDFNFDVTLKNRLVLKQFLDRFSLEELNKIPDGFNNNIFWNIAHTVVTQQLLVYNLSGLKMNVSDDLVANYRKGTKPEGEVVQEEMSRVKDLLLSTIEQTETDYKKGLFENYKSYTVTTGTTLNSVEDAITFNNFHEGLHLGSILALRKAIR